MDSSAKNGAVKLVRGQTAERLDNLLICYLIASSIVFPFISSVAIEDAAIAEPQPKVSNFTSVITLFSIFRYIFIISPHFALPTCPIPSAFSIEPTFLRMQKMFHYRFVYKAILISVPFLL